MIAKTPRPPYFAVIFTTVRTEGDLGYDETAALMEELVSKQEGFLGLESARDGLGITVCYWDSLESIRKWKSVEEHRVAQEKGKSVWYSAYKVRICRVENEYGSL